MSPFTSSSRHLFLQALVAFLALPGVVAFAVPLTLFDRPPFAQMHAIGWMLVALGAVVLLATVREFYVAGRGTLAPWKPPRHLVISGFYRFSRNPMYLGVLLILAGWAAGFRSPALVMYALAIALVFHVRILVHEEPFLARTHGDAWRTYASRVHRWFGHSS